MSASTNEQILLILSKALKDFKVDAGMVTITYQGLSAESFSKFASSGKFLEYVKYALILQMTSASMLKKNKNTHNNITLNVISQKAAAIEKEFFPTAGSGIRGTLGARIMEALREKIVSICSTNMISWPINDSTLYGAQTVFFLKFKNSRPDDDNYGQVLSDLAKIYEKEALPEKVKEYVGGRILKLIQHAHTFKVNFYVSESLPSLGALYKNEDAKKIIDLKFKLVDDSLVENQS